MKTDSTTRLRVRWSAVGWVALAAVALAGCAADGVSSADRAQAQVSAKEKALAQAEEEFSTASETFCEGSETYVLALDRYGDVLNDTAPTVGDVREAGADLTEPLEAASAGAASAVEAQAQLVVATQELADARASLAQIEAGESGSPDLPETPEPTSTPLVPPATVQRVEQAQGEFEAALSDISDETPLSDGAESFNSAIVALEIAWLRLFADAGCLNDAQEQQAAAAVTAYTAALQQELADTGHYDGDVDGVYGPKTVAAVEELQSVSGLPVTGTVDKATADALQAELAALAGGAAQQSTATTAAVQQTLRLAGFWDGPVDGVWTPALTEAVMALQTELGVAPTGNVDAATISAFDAAISERLQPEPSASPSPAPSS